MAFLSKYGVARHIYVPVIKRAVVDFAVSADWTPSAGDVKISKDGGAAANVTNLPTAITMGNGAIWDFSLSATEMQAAQVVITVADAATKAVEDTAFIIETYGNASGQHPFDLATATPAVNVTQFGGAALTSSGGRPEVNTSHIAGSAVSTASAQIGVNVVNYGGSAGTFSGGRPEVNMTRIGGSAISTSTAQLGVNAVQVGTTAQTGRDLGASVLLSPGTGTGQVSLSSGTVTVGTNNDKTGYALSAAAVQAIWDALTSALTTAGSIGKKLVDNITGDAYVRLGAPVGASISADVAAIPTATQNADALLKRDMSAVSGEAARSPLNAFRWLRNKWSIDTGVLTVTKEDDTTSAWTAAVGTTASNPVSSVDPT